MRFENKVPLHYLFRPCTPPDRFDFVLTFPSLSSNKSLCSEPFKKVPCKTTAYFKSFGCREGQALLLPNLLPSGQKQEIPNQRVTVDRQILIRQLNHLLFWLLVYEIPFFLRSFRMGQRVGKIQFDLECWEFIDSWGIEYREFVRHRLRFELAQM